MYLTESSLLCLGHVNSFMDPPPPPKEEEKSIHVGKDVADGFISEHKGTPVTATQSG